MQEILAEEGYVASNSEKYPLGGIVSAIQNAFGATPEFECLKDAVEEVYLCFDKTFKVRHCIYILHMILDVLQTAICTHSFGLIAQCYLFSLILLLLSFDFKDT